MLLWWVPVLGCAIEEGAPAPSVSELALDEGCAATVLVTAPPGQCPGGVPVAGGRVAVRVDGPARLPQDLRCAPEPSLEDIAVGVPTEACRPDGGASFLVVLLGSADPVPVESNP